MTSVWLTSHHSTTWCSIQPLESARREARQGIKNLCRSSRIHVVHQESMSFIKNLCIPLTAQPLGHNVVTFFFFLARCRWMQPKTKSHRCRGSGHLQELGTKQPSDMTHLNTFDGAECIWTACCVLHAKERRGIMRERIVVLFLIINTVHTASCSFQYHTNIPK